MITFFTIPRPFNGIYEIIQKNAILSWQQIIPKCEIFIYGDDPSVVSFANQIGVGYSKTFKSNNYGTPLLDDIWNSAKTISSNDLVCYLNSDIILFSNFVEKIGTIKLKKFLIAGRRWDIEINQCINFQSDWESSLKQLIEQKGSMHPETGVDYFLFPKYLLPEMPPFAIGRAWWDNWLLYYFKKHKIPIIDGTNIMTVHQNHDYSHIRSVNSHTTFKGMERDENQKLAGLKYWEKINIGDATHYYSGNRVYVKPILERANKLIDRYVKRTLIIIRDYLFPVHQNK